MAGVLFCIIVAALVSWKLTLITFAIVPFFWLLIFKMFGNKKKNVEKGDQAYQKSVHFIVNMILKIKSVISLGIEQKAMEAIYQ